MRILFSDGEFLKAAMTADRESVSVSCDRASYSGPKRHFDNGETSLYPGLLQCGIEAAKDGGELLCCGSCLYFRFSGPRASATVIWVSSEGADELMDLAAQLEELSTQT